MRGNPKLGFAKLRDALRRGGAVAVLDQHGQIPPDYKEKIGRSFQAVLTEIWDKQSEGDRRLLKTLAQLGENVFVPEAALPLLVDLPPEDPLGLGPAPLGQTLGRLALAQLIERNEERGQLRLHPLIHEFSRARCESGFGRNLVQDVTRRLAGAEALLDFVPTR
jgi:hypothetical protein